MVALEEVEEVRFCSKDVSNIITIYIISKVEVSIVEEEVVDSTVVEVEED